MAYFVTGGTGFIGRFLVGNLLKRGEPVYVLVARDRRRSSTRLREDLGRRTKSRSSPCSAISAKPLLGVSRKPI